MITQNTKPAVFSATSAFTLVELLIAATITLFAVVGAAALMIQSTKIYSTDANQLSVNYDMHKFMQGMETDAAFANSFYIYDTATNGAIPISGPDNYVSSGQSGDTLLLISTSTDNTGATFVTQIIAYYRTVTTTAANSGPLYRYATASNLNAAGTTPIYQLYNTYIKPNLPLNSYLASIVGTAQNTNGTGSGNAQKHQNLFYHLGYAFMVRSQIREQQNGLTVLAIDTYNLTIWPRG